MKTMPSGVDKVAVKPKNADSHCNPIGGTAQNLQLRSQLMFELDMAIKARRLTQLQAANMLGIQQSRVSDLVRGKVDRFSLDTLVRLLEKTGKKVTLLIDECVA